MTRNQGGDVKRQRLGSPVRGGLMHGHGRTEHTGARVRHAERLQVALELAVLTPLPVRRQEGDVARAEVCFGDRHEVDHPVPDAEIVQGLGDVIAGDQGTLAFGPRPTGDQPRT